MPSEYNDRLGFNARKYINTVTYGRRHADRWPGNSTPYRGDIWFAQLGFAPGTCTTTGLHPVLVISNNENNYRNEIITVIPITSNTSRLYLPTQVGIRECELARVKEPSSAVMTVPVDVNQPVNAANANTVTTAHGVRAHSDDIVFKDGALLLDQVTTIDKALLRDYVGRVRSDKLADIELALRRHLGMSG